MGGHIYIYSEFLFLFIEICVCSKIVKLSKKKTLEKGDVCFYKQEKYNKKDRVLGNW